MLYSSVSAIRLKTFSPNSQMQFSELQRQEPVIILSGLLTPFKSCSQTSAEVLSRFSQHSLTIPRFFSALPLGDLSYSSVPLCLPFTLAFLHLKHKLPFLLKSLPSLLLLRVCCFFLRKKTKDQIEVSACL